MKVLAGTLGVSDQESRAGVVTFSYNSEHSIKLKDHQDISSFNDAVDNIPLMGSTTRIDKALRLTQRELFDPTNGARPGIAKILILLTDGSQTLDADAEDPGTIAQEIRDTGVKMLVIGIGAGVNQTELDHIAGDDEFAFSAATFDELIGGEFVQQIVEGSCSLGNFFQSHCTCTRNITSFISL